ncbi:hypothetical protein FRB94_009696 [Tulasnella sp. JGI-2019a]|nr:hypothetical protein FRB94_009696 [Tulasnella sp. JGI-2019a]
MEACCGNGLYQRLRSQLPPQQRTVTNTDIVEANNFGQRIFWGLSVTDVSETSAVNTRPLILTPTSLAQGSYKVCLDTFKKRLGLFIGGIVNAFKDVIE